MVSNSTPRKSTTTTPLVSVVLATYNGEKFLRQQLDSLLAQTYTNLEIVAVDDASRDGTVGILTEYAAAHPNIRVYDTENNLGYVKNFERGLRLCTGDYIALCDQDDVWLPEKISRCLGAIGSHPLLYHNSALTDADGEPLGVYLSDTKRLVDLWSPLNYVVGGSAAGHAMLLRREVVERSLPLPSVVPHDYWIGFVATLFGPIKYLDEVLVLYRQHGGNTIGVNTDRTKAAPRQKITALQRRDLARERVRLMYEKCPPHLPEKAVLGRILDSYQDFFPARNLRRMQIFLSHRREITAYKKRDELRRWLFGVKMFFKII